MGVIDAWWLEKTEVMKQAVYKAVLGQMKQAEEECPKALWVCSCSGAAWERTVMMKPKLESYLGKYVRLGKKHQLQHFLCLVSVPFVFQVPPHPSELLFILLPSCSFSRRPTLKGHISRFRCLLVSTRSTWSIRTSWQEIGKREAGECSQSIYLFWGIATVWLHSQGGPSSSSGICSLPLSFQA